MNYITYLSSIPFERYLLIWIRARWQRKLFFFGIIHYSTVTISLSSKTVTVTILLWSTVVNILVFRQSLSLIFLLLPTVTKKSVLQQSVATVIKIWYCDRKSLWSEVYLNTNTFLYSFSFEKLFKKNYMFYNIDFLENFFFL